MTGCAGPSSGWESSQQSAFSVIPTRDPESAVLISVISCAGEGALLPRFFRGHCYSSRRASKRVGFLATLGIENKIPQELWIASFLLQEAGVQVMKARFHPTKPKSGFAGAPVSAAAIVALCCT